MQDRKKLREGINGQPEPEHLPLVTEPCAQFVQLQVWEPKMAEGAVVQDLRVLTSTSEKGS